MCVRSVHVHFHGGLLHVLEVRFRTTPGSTHLHQVVEEDEGGLHNARVLVAEHPAEVVLQVGHQARREEEEMVHGHDGLLAYQLPVGRERGVSSTAGCEVVDRTALEMTS